MIRRPFLTPFRHEFGGRTVNMGIVEHTIPSAHSLYRGENQTFFVSTYGGLPDRESERPFIEKEAAALPTPPPPTPINPTSFPSSSSSTHSSFPQSLSREKTFHAAARERERVLSIPLFTHSIEGEGERDPKKDLPISPQAFKRGGGIQRKKRFAGGGGTKGNLYIRKGLFILSESGKLALL